MLVFKKNHNSETVLLSTHINMDCKKIFTFESNALLGLDKQKNEFKTEHLLIHQF